MSDDLGYRFETVRVVDSYGESRPRDGASIIWAVTCARCGGFKRWCYYNPETGNVCGKCADAPGRP